MGFASHFSPDPARRWGKSTWYSEIEEPIKSRENHRIPPGGDIPRLRNQSNRAKITGSRQEVIFRDWGTNQIARKALFTCVVYANRFDSLRSQGSAGKSVLTLENVRLSDVATYTCQASNNARDVNGNLIVVEKSVQLRVRCESMAPSLSEMATNG